MNRQEINKKILKILTELNENWPDQRFSQLLINSGVTISSFDFETLLPLHEINFNEESDITLERIGKISSKLEKM